MNGRQKRRLWLLRERLSREQRKLLLMRQEHGVTIEEVGKLIAVVKQLNGPILAISEQTGDLK